MSGLPKQVRFHGSPSTNRESIRQHGLDWKRRPEDAFGIANGWSGVPEEEGILLSHGDGVSEALFFVRMGSGREIDVWEVDVTGLRLEPGPDGWLLCRTEIESQRVRLVETWATGRSRSTKVAEVFAAEG